MIWPLSVDLHACFRPLASSVPHTLGLNMCCCPCGHENGVFKHRQMSIRWPFWTWCISTMVPAAVVTGHDTRSAPRTAKRSWPLMWQWRVARGQTVCEKASHSMSRLYPCEVRGGLALLVRGVCCGCCISGSHLSRLVMIWYIRLSRLICTRMRVLYELKPLTPPSTHHAPCQ